MRNIARVMGEDVSADEASWVMNALFFRSDYNYCGYNNEISVPREGWSLLHVTIAFSPQSTARAGETNECRARCQTFTEW